MDEALVKVLSLFAGIFGEGTIDIVNQAFNMAGTGQIITGEIANQALKTARRLGMGAFDSANHQSDNSLLGLIESLGFAGDVNKRSIDLASNSINGSQALAMLLAANGKSS